MSDKPDNDDTPLVRYAINVIVGGATYATANAIVKSNVREPETKTQKVILAIGSGVIAKMVSTAGVDYVNNSIDSWSRAFKKARQKADDKNNQS